MKLSHSAAALVAFAAFSLVAPAHAAAKTFNRDVELGVKHVAGKPLSVETRNGSVAVRRSEGDTVRIEAHLQSKSKERLEAARVVASRSADGELEISVVWPEGNDYKQGDGCSFEILVPDVSRTEVDTSNGAIELAGLSGEANIDTSNGSITVRDHAGPVVADTSNGAVTVIGAGGPVQADTSNGDIVIELADGASGPIVADSSNGSISIVVGPSFTGVMEAKTSNGAIKTTGGARAVLNRRLTQGEIVFGGGDAGDGKSRVSTTNGGISVKVRS